MDTDHKDETSTSTEVKKPQFGTRYLTDNSAVFEQNAWDHVEWEPEQLAAAQAIVANQHAAVMDNEQCNQLEENAANNWDSFYDSHSDKFFKDRKWLLTEFPELLETSSPDNKRTTTTLLEVGCGVGNTVFPVLQATRGLFVFCCDFSSSAIEILRSQPEYNPERCRAFVWDITQSRDHLDDQGGVDETSAATSSNHDVIIQPASLDFISLIFVLSAVPPNKMQSAVTNLVRLLKPGGRILFRDYGLYDLTQLRLKPDAHISENYYRRGDGTFVSYFTQEQIDRMFVTESGLHKLHSYVDRRLIVNRAKQTKMYRVWLQARYQKPQQQVEQK